MSITQLWCERYWQGKLGSPRPQPINDRLNAGHTDVPSLAQNTDSDYCLGKPFGLRSCWRRMGTSSSRPHPQMVLHSWLPGTRFRGTKDYGIQPSLHYQCLIFCGALDGYFYIILESHLCKNTYAKHPKPSPPPPSRPPRPFLNILHALLVCVRCCLFKQRIYITDIWTWAGKTGRTNIELYVCNVSF